MLHVSQVCVSTLESSWFTVALYRTLSTRRDPLNGQSPILPEQLLPGSGKGSPSCVFRTLKLSFAIYFFMFGRHRVSINNFWQWMILGETIMNKLKKLFTNICLIIFWERWVEINYLLWPSWNFVFYFGVREAQNSTCGHTHLIPPHLCKLCTPGQILHSLKILCKCWLTVGCFLIFQEGGYSAFCMV